MARAEWKRILAGSITNAQQLCGRFPASRIDTGAVEEVAAAYPMLINPYYLGLIKRPGDPLWKQAVPDRAELLDTTGMCDPLAEEDCSPVPGIVHRYPDRVLFLVSHQCAMYCRFCTRKRKIGTAFAPIGSSLKEALAYIRQHKQIRDVLVSGGDPLLLGDETLEETLQAVRAISHVEIIRIGTRVPCLLPQRITRRLVDMLRRFHPMYVNTHFNHPAEITPEAHRACRMLSDAGIPLGCQTVLLKGVNDTPEVMKQLMQQLLTIRVRPYYIHHMDLTTGTAHFRTPIQTGLAIAAALRGHTSGMCVPHYVIDLPDGGGKIPLLPEHIVSIDRQELRLKNFQGRVFPYPISREDAEALSKRYASRSS